jgi:hypothetical protein
MQFGSNPCILFLASKSSKRFQASEVAGLQHLLRRQLLELSKRLSLQCSKASVAEMLHEPIDSITCLSMLRAHIS